jgi:signal transduction histidine kinase/DNA-binding response OmpR family regulator
VNGRVALIRDLSALLAAGAMIFAIDLASPPTLIVSLAYVGVALFIARPARARTAIAFAALASFLICIDLGLEGELALALSDALVSGLLAITLTWMVVLVGITRASTAPRAIRFQETSAPPTDADLQSHADIVKLTELQRTLLDRLNLATRTAGLAIWDRDLVAGTIYVDDGIAKLYGLPTARGLEDVRGVIHPEDFERMQKTFDAAVSDPNAPLVVTDRFRIVRKNDGALRHLQLHRRLFRGRGGKTERIIGVLWDVTDEVTAAQALIDATEAAQAANRAKSALLANVSHEIRTPMNGIMGMIGLLLDSELSAAQREYAETIRGSANSLLRVIDDILDFSKIEAGRMEVESVPTDLRRTVEDVHALMSFQAAQKGLALTVNIEQDVPARVLSDPQRLRQCLVNLVGNAIKFTHAGNVTIDVKLVPQALPTALTRFEVRDTGIGIEPEAIARLFEPFVQADSSTTRNFGGTGLGLSIVKRFVEMMDGRVGVSSVLGQGAAFWFDLPLVAVAGTGHDPASLREASGASASDHAFDTRFEGRVLVVEDNPVNQKVARRILERFGCEVEIAEHGAEAIERCERSQFALVLMDMQMPVMDGLTATTLIRQRELGKRRTPIVALTANAMNGEYDRCMAVGMDGFLTKPLDIERLRQLLIGFGLHGASGASAPDREAVLEPALLTALTRAAPVELAKLEEITGADAQFTTELLETFFGSANESLERMTQTLGTEDRAELARLAHRLKGAALNIHALAVATLAAQLEQDAKTAPFEALALSLDELRGLVDEVAEFMREARASAIRAA